MGDVANIDDLDEFINKTKQKKQKSVLHAHLDEILKLRKSKVSYADIAEFLSQKRDVHTDAANIFRFLNRVQKAKKAKAKIKAVKQVEEKPIAIEVTIEKPTPKTKPKQPAKTAKTEKKTKTPEEPTPIAIDVSNVTFESYDTKEDFEFTLNFLQPSQRENMGCSCKDGVQYAYINGKTVQI